MDPAPGSRAHPPTGPGRRATPLGLRPSRVKGLGPRVRATPLGLQAKSAINHVPPAAASPGPPPPPPTCWQLDRGLPEVGPAGRLHLRGMLHPPPACTRGQGGRRCGGGVQEGSTQEGPRGGAGSSRAAYKYQPAKHWFQLECQLCRTLTEALVPAHHLDPLPRLHGMPQPEQHGHQPSAGDRPLVCCQRHSCLGAGDGGQPGLPAATSHLLLLFLPPPAAAASTACRSGCCCCWPRGCR